MAILPLIRNWFCFPDFFWKLENSFISSKITNFLSKEFIALTFRSNIRLPTFWYIYIWLALSSPMSIPNVVKQQKRTRVITKLSSSLPPDALVVSFNTAVPPGLASTPHGTVLKHFPAVNQMSKPPSRSKESGISWQHWTCGSDFSVYAEGKGKRPPTRNKYCFITLW